MRRCWAATLGGCSDKASREHLISEGLFASQTVRVQGFAWCAGEPLEIGLSSLTAKILCEHHNSKLSEVDEAGIAAFGALRESQRLLNVRSGLPRNRWTVKRFSISGPGLESWFLKTAINLSYQGPSKAHPVWAGPGGSESWEPPEQLVEVAFGRRAFEPYQGVYMVGRKGSITCSDDTVAFAPLLRRGELVGGLFEFQGFQFVLSVLHQVLPGVLDLPGLKDHWAGTAVHYRVPRFYGEVSGVRSHEIRFVWP